MCLQAVKIDGTEWNVNKNETEWEQWNFIIAHMFTSHIRLTVQTINL